MSLRFKIRKELKKTDFRRLKEFIRDKPNVPIAIPLHLDLEFMSISPLILALESRGYRMYTEISFQEPIGFEVYDNLCLENEKHIDLTVNRRKFRISKIVSEPRDLEKDLNTILKTAKADESLKMALDDETKRFVLEFAGKNQNRKFSLSLIDIPEEGNIPDSIHIDFDTNFEVKASFIQQVLKDAEMVSDYLRIKAKEDGIFFSAESDTKEMETFIEPKSEEMDTESFQVTEESEAVYSLDFLMNFLKGIRSSDYVKLSFTQEQPIRIIYELEDKGHLIYFVAPRIEESDEIDENSV